MRKYYSFKLPVRNRLTSNYKINATAEYFLYVDDVKNEFKIYNENIYLNYDGNQIVNNPGAKHYRLKKSKNFREFIIKNSSLSKEKTKSGFDIYNIPCETITYINTNINNHISTILQIEDFLSGSNVAGSLSNIKNTPLYIGGYKYDGYRFVHILNKFRKSDKTINVEKSDIEQITFDEFLDIFNIRNTFEIYNRDIISYLEEIPLKEDWIEELTNIGITGIENNKNLSSDIQENLFHTRNKLRDNLLKEYKKDNIYEKYPVEFLEAAHIKPVKYIDEFSEELSDIENGLLLTPSHHSLFDRNFFTFDISGDIIYQKKYENVLKHERVFDINIKKLLNTKMNDYLNFRKIKFYQILDNSESFDKYIIN
jgi:hypothetical protein